MLDFAQKIGVLKCRIISGLPPMDRIPGRPMHAAVIDNSKTMSLYSKMKFNSYSHYYISAGGILFWYPD